MVVLPDPEAVAAIHTPGVAVDDEADGE